MTLAKQAEDLNAEIEAAELANRLEQGEVPIAEPPALIAPGDACHFVVPVRFGRRRSDQYGHLLLTGGWLKFRGALDVSVAWDEVATVHRVGRDIIVSLEGSRRLLRFACHSVTEAARGGVIAQHLTRRAHPHTVDINPTYHASV